MEEGWCLLHEHPRFFHSDGCGYSAADIDKTMSPDRRGPLSINIRCTYSHERRTQNLQHPRSTSR
jgi:hypothetical protein